MKVAFNARSLVYPSLRGWNRYTINLLAELATVGIKIFLYSDKPLHSNHLARLDKNSYKVRIAPSMPRYWLWEQHWLPRQCKIDQVDLLHSPINFGLPISSPCPRLLTLHDAIEQVYYPKYMSLQEKLSISNIRNQIYHLTARKSADYIVTDSLYSKTDFVRHLSIPEDKVTVVYLAADAEFHKPISDTTRLTARNRHQLNFPYIFYIGGWEKRKNIPFLVQAFAEANLDSSVKLVLGGGTEEERAELIQLAESLNILERIELLGWIDDADLPALYAEAVCFVYPSEYEGFGLQLCEAMAVGCPVLAAKATSLPEILGTGGETFEVSQTQGLVIALQRITTDSSYRSELVDRAKERAKLFSWKKTALETQKVYHQMLKMR